ncbi:CPBP family intramembrane metalloprotease [Brevibacillus sp. SYP-B805]|uniref:CPBP family intramembrane glutamic endopeptidase n=1 Tax=Brevibacillus sp. SYP-B805 TaxID=1578199 RepID=UPI0013EBF56A|nr:CPBP family intramembrane glutamic endopeptidase [Brevibacillus sp. SYP-B805]NGQ96513.1 CPBP family intramembrane metalloprotease [Brevibacillus sp. SYP-B805]
MQTGLEVPVGSGRETRGSRRWAVPLFLGFLFTTLAELTTIRFVPGKDGRWVVRTAEDPGDGIILFVLGVSLLTLVCGIGFLIQWARERIRGGGGLWPSRMVSGTDVIVTCAWLQLLQIVFLFVTELFLPPTLFAEGTAAGMLESASLQFFILAVAFFRFRGRGTALGFCRPRRPGRMLAAILLLLGLILFVLDLVVTNPVADLFHLSLDSEREQQIQQEILASQSRDPLHFWANVAIVGLIVPLAEEILFRGVIQTYLVHRFGAIIGIGVSSFWFALLHVDPALFAPLFAIGLALGILRHRFQSLWGAIILHSLNNLFSVMVHL